MLPDWKKIKTKIYSGDEVDHSLAEAEYVVVGVDFSFLGGKMEHLLLDRRETFETFAIELADYLKGYESVICTLDPEGKIGWGCYWENLGRLVDGQILYPIYGCISGKYKLLAYHNIPKNCTICNAPGKNYVINGLSVKIFCEACFSHPRVFACYHCGKSPAKLKDSSEFPNIKSKIRPLFITDCGNCDQPINNYCNLCGIPIVDHKCTKISAN